MKKYDLISIGTGSAMTIVDVLIKENPNIKVAVIDKDEPGGICLTRGCIPSKILLYPAELVRGIEKAPELGVEAEIKHVNFRKIMERMRALIQTDIDGIRQGLSESKNIDYYRSVAEFVAPYTLKVGNEIITSQMILLCTGSRPIVPRVDGLTEAGYHTSDTILKMEQLPKSIAIIGGGYIAAEYGHFFSSMGSRTTILGRNPQFLPQEEPEISALAQRELGKHMTIMTNCEVRQARKAPGGERILFAFDKRTQNTIEIKAEEILVASGRGPNTDILHPEKGGINTDKNGWIAVNEYLETSQPNVWALGDADGKYLFKHVANYEALVVYYNAVLKRNMKADYHAIPHAIFTYPEIASVGLSEKHAVEEYSKDGILIGASRYQDTAKGEAMGLEDYFVKVIVQRETMKILGASIIGPYASILIQEVITLMYTKEQTAFPILIGMHIHPALSEVVENAFRSLMTPDEYHQVLEHHYGLS